MTVSVPYNQHQLAAIWGATFPGGFPQDQGQSEALVAAVELAGKASPASTGEVDAAGPGQAPSWYVTEEFASNGVGEVFDTIQPRNMGAPPGAETTQADLLGQPVSELAGL